jgi:prepilin-type processing-associated H-X9-DG protein
MTRNVLPTGASCARRRRGITLTETLVAISIMTAMVGLLVPALGTVRSEARSSTCLSHLRHLGTGMTAYTSSYRGRFPPAIVYFVSNGGLVTHAWDFRHEADGSVEPGALRGFTDRPEIVQQCPCCTESSTFGNDPATGYNYNTTYLGDEGRLPTLGDDGRVIEGWQNARRGIPLSRHRRTSTTAMLGDGGWSAGANKFMRAPSNDIENDWGTVYAGGQAYRHSGRTNVAWLDGHLSSEPVAHDGPQADTAFATDLLGSPANGFLSSDDSSYDPR